MAGRSRRAVGFVGGWADGPWDLPLGAPSGRLDAVAFAVAVTYLPPLQRLFGTAAVEPRHLLLLLPFPLVVWGADEIARWLRRRADRRRPSSQSAA